MKLLQKPTPPTAKYLGVDNGKHGGFMVIDANNTVVKSYEMPVVEGEKSTDRKEYDIPAIARIFAENRDVALCTLEKVFVMPMLAKSTAMSLGWCLGLMEMACAANGIPYIIAPPKEWQKKLFVGQSYDDTKTMSIKYAKALQPGFDWNAGGSKPHDGLSDAYCLALYGKQTLFGN